MPNLLSKLACIALVIAGCVPTAARKNARIEGGVDVDFTAGVQHVERGERSDGTSLGPTQIVHAEVDLQWGHKEEDGSGFAVQLKAPYTVVFTTLDFYYQLPENHGPWYFGFGAELGALPGLYGIATHYLDDDFYFSLTSRALFAESRDEKAVLLNPQLSLGMAGETDLSAFVSYAYHTGQGFNFDIFSDDPDYRKKYWLSGVSARF